MKTAVLGWRCVPGEEFLRVRFKGLDNLADRANTAFLSVRWLPTVSLRFRNLKAILQPNHNLKRLDTGLYLGILEGTRGAIAPGEAEGRQKFEFDDGRPYRATQVRFTSRLRLP